MEKYDVNFKKKYGQNFLKDKRIVNSIVDISGVSDDTLVIEVGPGGAIMTQELALRAKWVLAYEIDSDLEDELSNRLIDYKNVDIVFKDFLQADISVDIKNYDYERLLFVSNIPYYITTPIILKLLKSRVHFDKIVLMVQKEVGERLCSLPGNREYGSITVLLNCFYDIKKEMSVSRNNFVPKPNVDSVIISFVEKEKKHIINDFGFFEKIVRDSFQYKRKTLKNNLRKYDLDIVKEVLGRYGYDLNVRAECLDVSIFVDLSNELKK